MSKLLWYGESSYVETGAGQVAKHLLPVFRQLFEHVHHVPINQHWTPPALPSWYTVTPSDGRDPYNKQNLRNALNSLDFDVLFLTGDVQVIGEFTPQILHARAQGKRVIMYAAMDTQIYTRGFWEVLTHADIPVVFSHWCKRQALVCIPEVEDRLQVIYHGCEPDVFYPLPDEERKAVREELFGITDDRFIVLNVNRNQMRKDLARTIAAFRLFNGDMPNSLLYLHSKQHDLGGDLVAMANYFGLETGGIGNNVVFTPHDYNEAVGVSRADMNRIYNAADVVVSTSTGEGWGIPTTECMAAERPFIGPDNTVFSEQLGEPESWACDFSATQRGMLVKSGGPDLWVVPYGISTTPREICSTTGLVSALHDVYKYPSLAQERATRARQWALQHTWPMKQAEWLKLFEEVIP